MGTNMSEEEGLGGFREGGVLDGWFGGFKHVLWVALGI